MSESGAEFGSQNIPGVLGTDYIWPDTSAIQTLRNAGMNIFRVPFLMERLVPTTLTSTPNEAYLEDLKSVCCPQLKCNLYSCSYRRWNTSLLLARMRLLTHTILDDS